MAHKLLAFLLFVFVIIPWGWLRRGKTAQHPGNWHARRTTWDQRGAGGQGPAPGRTAPRSAPAATWAASAKPNKGSTQ
ncbi:MAG: hypothetical protein V4864_05795 [Pseudomonadota bacterium]